MDSLQRIEATYQQGDLLACIELCQRELVSLERSFNPHGWARLHSMLAQCYLDFCREGEMDELEAVIHHCEQALQILTKHAYPEDWAACQTNLGHAFWMNPNGDRSDNVERSIQHYQKALHIWTQQRNPEHWVGLMVGLADAFKERTRGSRPENLQLARQHYTQALEVLALNQNSEQWRQVQLELADLFRESDQGKGGKSIEEAIDHYQQALTVTPQESFPSPWAYIHHGLGECFCMRTAGDREHNIERSISHFKLALQVIQQESHPEQWASTVSSLGVAYQQRIIGSRPENLSLAIYYFELAMEVVSRKTSPDDWAKLQVNLGTAYLDIVGPQQYTEQAIVFFHSALEVITREKEAELWATIHYRLGNAYRQRRWRDVSRYWQGDVGIEQKLEQRTNNLEHAIRHYRSALQIFNRAESPGNWAMVQDSLGQAYLDRIRGSLTENVEQAILHFDQALLVRDRMSVPELWAATQLNLGIAYEKRTIESPASPAENKRQAVHYYRQALQVFESSHFPLLARKALHNLAGLYFARGQWQKAVEAYDKVDRIRVDPDSMYYAEQAREFDTKSSANHYPNAAYCLLKLGRPAKAFDRLEQGRLRFLSDALERRKGDTHVLLAEPSTTFVLDESALIAPLVTSQGGAIFVILGESSALEMDNVIFVDNLDDQAIDGLLEEWLRIYIGLRQAESNAEDWRSAIERITNELWLLLFEPIHELLKRQRGIQHLVLIPQDRLRLLPLNAAWRWDESERRYLLDDYTVSFAPARQILNQCVGRLQQAKSDGSLVVGAESFQLSSVSLAAAEVQTVADILGATPLVSQDASKESVLQAIGGKGLLHFACRASYGGYGDPLESRLLLNQGQALALGELVASPALQGSRLVVLSACETGIANLGPGLDEYFGLPDGILLLGAAGVLSSLWVINDHHSAFLLVERFYRNYLYQNLAPAQALREAQLWLRDVSRTELGEYLKSHTQLAAREAVAAAFEARLDGDPEERLFANPFYWATFMFAGA